MRPALALLAALTVAAPALAQPGLDPGARDGQMAPMPPGPHLKLTIEASKATHYQMLCQVRRYRKGPGQFVNRYGVDTSGPYQDTVLSPNATCWAEIVTGPAPVKITLAKPGAVQSITLTTPGPAGKTKLLVF